MKNIFLKIHNKFSLCSNVKCSFVYVTFVSRVFAPKHLLIVFMPDLCVNFIQKVTLLL